MNSIKTSVSRGWSDYVRTRNNRSSAALPSVPVIVCICDGGIVSIRTGSGNDVISGRAANNVIFGVSDQAASWNYRVGELDDITRSGDDGDDQAMRAAILRWSGRATIF